MLAAMTDDLPRALAWDQRYAEPGFQFGTEPNDFLREVAHHLPRGRVLCLAEGEGRNAVWLAQQGHAVTGMDQSRVGLQKAERLAAERGVTIATQLADLATFDLGIEAWQGIASIFAHVEANVRWRVHAAIPKALVPGGVFLLEAYTPAQIGRGTGGPPEDERMVSLERLRAEIQGLEWLLAREIERDVIEGPSHSGRASVVQLVARRPA